jgi:predicted nucleotidyltransferase
MNGDRVDRSTGRRYRRIPTLVDEYRYLVERYSYFINFDDFYGREVPLVPVNSIEFIYNPLKKAEELIASSTPLDLVLEDVKEMVEDIAMATGVKDIGVSGSVLVNLYTNTSDIDIVVYGVDNGVRVYRYLLEVVGKDPRYRRYSPENLYELFRRRVLETPITLKYFVEQVSRKVLEGYFKNREYFVRLVKYSWEEPSYGSYRCRKLGKTLAKLRVVDDRESIYTPCRYRVEVVEHIKGVKVDIEEVYSLRGRFAEIAKKDDIVIAFGTVELIEMKNSRVFYRLYLGDEGDYMMVAR